MKGGGGKGESGKGRRKGKGDGMKRGESTVECLIINRCVCVCVCTFIVHEEHS